jgi:nucleoside phosphorylase
MPNAEDYTVGWICALSTESVAAQSFLDEEHAPLAYQDPKDNNDYTLGKIGNHNVVIAVLPMGQYGTTNAAIVARDLIRSFPNIRIGLMVGIGGGAPTSQNDIRLGDVVVGMSKNGQGEILQYDFGKTIQSQEFQRIPSQNNVPVVLQTGVHGLQTQYERKGHNLQEALKNAIQSNKRMRKKYSQPDPHTDRLYISTYEHTCNKEGSCSDICGDDPANTVLRSTREEDEDNPSIHYGIIASANSLMKDPVIRDTLAKKYNILCFEMEAAGLLSHFPCVVIRGICDYSDTHKNNEWQGYAAMTSAAYAKDLLCRIRPNKVEAESKISNVLDAISSGQSSCAFLW